MAVAELVSCQWLKDQLDTDDANVIVLDVTWYSDRDAQQNYDKEHIPGALYFNIMEGAIQTPVYQRNLPTAEIFQNNAQSAGVNSDSHVVVYSDTDKLGFLSSGRAWWMFKYFGHDTVSVLNGGWQKWCKEGYPKTTTVPKVTRGNFTAHVQNQYRKSYGEMKVRSGSPNAQITDSRAAQTFNNGHIPGAGNIPADTLMDWESGKLKTKQDLIELFRSSGVDLDSPVVTHCNSGISSCTMGLALSVAGCKEWAVYQGGYKEWQHNSKGEAV